MAKLSISTSGRPDDSLGRSEFWFRNFWVLWEYVDVYFSDLLQTRGSKWRAMAAEPDRPWVSDALQKPHPRNLWQGSAIEGGDHLVTLTGEWATAHSWPIHLSGSWYQQPMSRMRIVHSVLRKRE